MPTWDPRQYLTFAQERTQPAIDLVQRIPLAEAARIIDIGCGPGNSTQVLVQRYPKATVIGLDNSAEMIARARRISRTMEWRHATCRVRRRRKPTTSSSPMPSSNGFPNHEDLVPRLWGGAAGRRVRVPDPGESRLSLASVTAGRWRSGRSGPRTCRETLCAWSTATCRSITICSRRSPRRLELWETTYYHTLASHRGLDRMVTRHGDASVLGEAAGRGGAGAV